jgi:threonine dehydratase
MEVLFSFMLTLADIRDADFRIKDYIIHTPLIPSSTLSNATGCQIYLKPETLQKGGSFKIRGAMNRIFLHLNKIPDTPVVAASAGNHAQGVAIAAHIAGVQAIIVMPDWASLSKQEATRGYGAEVCIFGQTIEESVSRALEISRDGGLFIHPFDDEEVMAGQGTLALELFSDLSDIDVIIVPVGGGGLISGIAVAAKTIRPSCRIIGVQSDQCPCAKAASLQGEPVCIKAQRTIADGIRVTKIGELTFPYIRDLVDEIVTVSDDEVALSMLWLLEHKKIVSEGAGAASVAAILFKKCFLPHNSRVVPIISGGNVDSHQLSRILRRGLAIQGRVLRISVIIDDLPGYLARLLSIIGDSGGNILHIHHNAPGDPDIPVHEVRVDIELETRGPDHISEIKRNVTSGGFMLL